MDYETAIRGEIENIKRERELVELLLTKSKDHPLDDIEIRAAALSLSTIYNGIEKTLEFVLKDSDAQLPSGRNWHTSLLELAKNRSVIDKTTQTDLLGFLAFRHFVRHAYSFEIDPDAIMEILGLCPAIVESFRNQVESIYK